jgi:hypothetical protein
VCGKGGLPGRRPATVLSTGSSAVP